MSSLSSKRRPSFLSFQLLEQGPSALRYDQVLGTVARDWMTPPWTVPVDGVVGPQAQRQLARPWVLVVLVFSRDLFKMPQKEKEKENRSVGCY